MIKKTIIITTIISLISGSASAGNNANITLSDSNNDQFLALLAPLAIGAIALGLSKGAEPAAAKKDALYSIQTDVLKEASANSLGHDLNLNEAGASYALTASDAEKIKGSMAGVSRIADKAVPMLQELLKKKMTPEQAADEVTKKLSDEIAAGTVKEAAAADAK